MGNEIPKEISKFYHCTFKENAENIFNDGINKGVDGFVYLADSINDSAKFLFVRGNPLDNLVVFEVDRADLDEEKLDYSFDHNERFYGCKAYIYQDNIAVNGMLYKFDK